MKWFDESNTEGYDKNTLDVMNREMNEVYDSLTEEEKENKSLIDWHKERILEKHF